MENERTKTKTNDTVSLLAALGIGAGAYALTRRFRPSSLPQLRRLQKAAEEGGSSMLMPEVNATAPKEHVLKGMTEAFYGMPINKQAKVYYNTNPWEGERLTGEIINPHRINDMLENKRSFAALTQGKNITPKTINLEGQTPQSIREALGGEYIVKPQYGALEHIDDFARQEDLVNKTKKGMKALADPEGHIAQKLENPLREYRVHMLDGKAYGISNRRIENEKIRKAWEFMTGYGGGGALMPVFNRNKRRALADFVEQASKETKLTDLPEGEHVHAAFDVLETPEGFKIVDANSRPGTLMNPLINRQLNRLMTGRWGRDVSALTGFGAGAATYGAAQTIGDLE